MAINIFQTLNVIEVMENFIERRRPPEHIRSKLDIGYRIEDQSIYVFEIRPQWGKPEIIREYDLAKTTFVKSKNHWKVFWMRANLKWQAYAPQSTVNLLEEFCNLLDEDKYGCFWG